ncbi:MAG: gamma-glutamylcyclotransferase, partial [Acidobacteria bacterium]|nr:gamma-glutamylcyclotransferase [Acidobacteriota bacterium]
MPDLLFVYGTLRRGFSRHKILRRLGAKSAGRGSIRAELFDLGEYPGAKPFARLSARVVGELYAVPDREGAFKVLDATEGFQPHAPESSLFRRETVEVTLHNMRRVVAWVYWLSPSSA